MQAFAGGKTEPREQFQKRLLAVESGWGLPPPLKWTAANWLPSHVAQTRAPTAGTAVRMRP